MAGEATRAVPTPGSICSSCEHMFVTHPDYIRQKARQMRVEKDLTIDEIAERLDISRQTIAYWVRDLPLQRPGRANPGQRLGNLAMQRKFKERRDKAYEQGFAEYDDLIEEPTFRDFVCMYIGEGYKRNRNCVTICNSDPRVVILGQFWIRRFAINRVWYALQYHADQDPDELREFWGDVLKIDPG